MASEVLEIEEEKKNTTTNDPLYYDLEKLMKRKEMIYSGKSDDDAKPYKSKKDSNDEIPKYHEKSVFIYSNFINKPLFVQNKYWKYDKRIMLCGIGKTGSNNQPFNWKVCKDWVFECEAVRVRDGSIGYLLLNKRFGQIYSTTDARDNDGKFFVCAVNKKHYKGKMFSDKFVFYIDFDPEKKCHVITNLLHGKLMVVKENLPLFGAKQATVLSNSFYGRQDSITKAYYTWNVKVLN